MTNKLINLFVQKHYNITIRGKVQGVGFRWATLNSAKHFNVTGFVKNLPNGFVYIEAEGTVENLDAFKIWCNNGPSHSKVKDINISESQVENFQDFNVKY